VKVRKCERGDRRTPASPHLRTFPPSRPGASARPGEIGLSLGTNLGRRLDNLRRARRLIAGLPGVRVAASSPVYATEPVDVPPEFRHRAFLNAVLIVESALPAEALARRLRAIESAMGRRRTGARHAPRVIDIDVLYADRRRIRTPRLTVPHPRWSSRRFVAQPLADVRPNLILPGSRLTVAARLRVLPPKPRVTLLRPVW